MMLKLRLAERDNASNEIGKTDNNNSTTNNLTVINKDTLVTADFVTEAATSDSAYGAGISLATRSSRASASDFEFSESYL